MEISKKFIISIFMNVIFVLALVLVVPNDNLILITILEILTFINGIYLISKVLKEIK